MRFLIAVFALAMLVGVPGANAATLRATPYDFRHSTALDRLSTIDPEIGRSLVADVRKVVTSEARAPSYLEEVRVFNETSGITTICGFALIENSRRRFLMQIDRPGFVYVRVDPPYEHFALAGCERAMSTWTYRP